MATTLWGFWHSTTLSPNATSTTPQRNTRRWQQFVNQLEPEFMQLGDTGNSVKVLQLAMQALSVYKGMADGHFGPLTEDALCTLQEKLSVDCNGIFDESTWYALSFWAPHAI